MHRHSQVSLHLPGQGGSAEVCGILQLYTAAAALHRRPRDLQRHRRPGRQVTARVSEGCNHTLAAQLHLRFKLCSSAFPIATAHLKVRASGGDTKLGQLPPTSLQQQKQHAENRVFPKLELKNPENRV